MENYFVKELKKSGILANEVDDHNFAAEVVGLRIALEGNPVVVAAHCIVGEGHIVAVVRLGVGHMD